MVSGCVFVCETLNAAAAVRTQRANSLRGVFPFYFPDLCPSQICSPFIAVSVLHHVDLISQWHRGPLLSYVHYAHYVPPHVPGRARCPAPRCDWSIPLAVLHSGQQLPEALLPTSSIAAGISYTKRIKREVPIPRQLGHYGLSCFDYSH